ncbi:MAG: hypothetical protein KTR31_07300 [Myxococcales bacterium]|nr:hypothetical protein [Myxococcales bacterium]
MTAISEEEAEGDLVLFKPGSPPNNVWPDGFDQVNAGPWSLDNYCTEVAYPAPAEVDNCPAQMVHDPTLDTFQWEDGNTAPLDCDLNNSCCDALGVCGDLLAHRDDGAAGNTGSITGEVEILIDGRLTKVGVRGSATWSAEPCSNPAGTCPIYLGSLGLEVEVLAGSEGDTSYTLRPVNAALSAPIMGAWKPSTGEVVFAQETVLFELTAEASIEIGRTVVSRSYSEKRRTNNGLRGTLQDGVLSLSSTHTASKTGTVSFDVTARAAR